MAESLVSMEQLSRDVRLAYEQGDVELFGALLAPDVTWGPPGASSTCRNKSQVLSWYQKGANAGSRADVREIEIVGDQLLVGLSVIGPSSVDHPRALAQRWQVLTVKESQIVDIVGFELRSDAVAWISH